MSTDFEGKIPFRATDATPIMADDIVKRKKSRTESLEEPFTYEVTYTADGDSTQHTVPVSYHYYSILRPFEQEYIQRMALTPK